MFLCEFLSRFSHVLLRSTPVARATNPTRNVYKWKAFLKFFFFASKLKRFVQIFSELMSLIKIPNRNKFLRRHTFWFASSGELKPLWMVFVWQNFSHLSTLIKILFLFSKLCACLLSCLLRLSLEEQEIIIHCYLVSVAQQLWSLKHSSTIIDYARLT